MYPGLFNKTIFTYESTYMKTEERLGIFRVVRSGLSTKWSI